MNPSKYKLMSSSNVLKKITVTITGTSGTDCVIKPAAETLVKNSILMEFGRLEGTILFMD